eukprot:3724740-Alexandrium_andersonii.AAC.1
MDMSPCSAGVSRTRLAFAVSAACARMLCPLSAECRGEPPPRCHSSASLMAHWSPAWAEAESRA